MIQLRTGEKYPHHGFLAGGRDPRMAEDLSNLAVARHGEDHEALLWVLCAGVWWMDRDRANVLAGVVAKLLGGVP